MNQNLSSDDLAKVLHLTQDLLARARSGDWDGAASLECERRPLLHEVFQPTAAGAKSPECQHAIRMILDIDRQVMELAQRRKEELRSELQGVGHGRTAIRAYTQQSR